MKNVQHFEPAQNYILIRAKKNVSIDLQGAGDQQIGIKKTLIERAGPWCQGTFNPGEEAIVAQTADQQGYSKIKGFELTAKDPDHPEDIFLLVREQDILGVFHDVEEVEEEEQTSENSEEQNPEKTQDDKTTGGPQ